MCPCKDNILDAAGQRIDWDNHSEHTLIYIKMGFNSTMQLSVTEAEHTVPAVGQRESPSSKFPWICETKTSLEGMTCEKNYR